MRFGAGVSILGGLGVTLNEGDSGEEVRTLQQSLTDLRYYTGPIDGRYGDALIFAVADFQKASGLPVTGSADDQTQALANSSAAVPNRGGTATRQPVQVFPGEEIVVERPPAAAEGIPWWVIGAGAAALAIGIATYAQKTRRKG